MDLFTLDRWEDQHIPAHGLLVCAVVFLVAAALDRLGKLVFQKSIQRARSGRHEDIATRLLLTERLGRVLLWTLALAIGANQFDTLRSLGTTMLASAGVLSLVVGMAARSTFANLVAGVQLAFTQPIRVGDMVTLRDETGEVEDISLTYTFIRTGDGRRLVFPNEVLSNEVIKNFTLRSQRSQANAVFFVGYGAELPAVRALLLAAAKTCPAWEGQAEPLSPPPEMGLDALTETAMKLKLTAWAVTPQLAAALGGQLREAGLLALQKARVPLPQSRVATLTSEPAPPPTEDHANHVHNGAPHPPTP